MKLLPVHQVSYNNSVITVCALTLYISACRADWFTRWIKIYWLVHNVGFSLLYSHLLFQILCPRIVLGSAEDQNWRHLPVCIRSAGDQMCLQVLAFVSLYEVCCSWIGYSSRFTDLAINVILMWNEWNEMTLNVGCNIYQLLDLISCSCVQSLYNHKA